MYYEWFEQNRKRIIAGIIIFVVLLSAWGIWVYVSRSGKVAVTISPVPRDATVTLDGQSVGSGTVWLKPGKYSVEAKKDGFESRQKTVEVTEQKDQNVVALSLTPQSDEAKKWADANTQAYTNNQSYGAIEAQTNGQYFTDKNPIVSHLPFSDPYFQITYTADVDNSVILTINTPSPRYRYFAIQKIREFGFDPADFKINFTDFKNPLE